jgi:hypothetical protein
VLALTTVYEFRAMLLVLHTASEGSIDFRHAECLETSLLQVIHLNAVF